MEKVRKSKKPYRLAARLTGIIVTVLMFLAVGFKLIDEFVEKGIQPLLDLPGEFITWDDPTAFSYTYFIGYIITWWKPLAGAIIILLGCILYFIMDTEGSWVRLIFILPALLVGILHIMFWQYNRKSR